MCENQLISGINFDGGYADYVIAPANALALIPDKLDDVNAGPLLCAGITTFNALRNSGARSGDTVAILGIGGLGHLAVQYAAKSGYRTVAIARGQDKAPLANSWARMSTSTAHPRTPPEELQKLGGANVILSTLTSAKALEWAMDGMAPAGKLIVVGAPEDGPLVINPLPLLLGRLTVAGWPSGTGMDSEDTLNFSALTGVKPMIETYPLEKAGEAFDRMTSGKARFRVVLTVGNNGAADLRTPGGAASGVSHSACPSGVSEAARDPVIIDANAIGSPTLYRFMHPARQRGSRSASHATGAACAAGSARLIFSFTSSPNLTNTVAGSGTRALLLPVRALP